MVRLATRRPRLRLLQGLLLVPHLQAQHLQRGRHKLGLAQPPVQLVGLQRPLACPLRAQLRPGLAPRQPQVQVGSAPRHLRPQLSLVPRLHLVLALLQPAVLEPSRLRLRQISVRHLLPLLRGDLAARRQEDLVARRQKDLEPPRRNLAPPRLQEV